jgi:hypothetical protein
LPEPGTFLRAKAPTGNYTIAAQVEDQLRYVGLGASAADETWAQAAFRLRESGGDRRLISSGVESM